MQNIIVEDISEYNLIFLVFCNSSMLPSTQALPLHLTSTLHAALQSEFLFLPHYFANVSKESKAGLAFLLAVFCTRCPTTPLDERKLATFLVK